MNNSLSPWGFTNFHGVRMAMMLTWMEPDWLTPLENLILIHLYSALVKGTDVIDSRMTQEYLAERCGVSLRTVKSAYKTFFKYNLARPLDEKARHYLLRVPVEDIERKLKAGMGHQY